MQGYDARGISSRQVVFFSVIAGAVLLALLFGAWRWSVASRARESAALSTLNDQMAEPAPASPGEDVPSCNEWEGADRDSCLWAVARSLGKEEPCTLIADAAVSTSCRQEILLTEAMKGEDVSRCEAVEDPMLAEGCASVVRHNLVAHNRCSEAYSADMCADIARLNEVVKAQDPEGCALIVDISLKEQCLEAVGAGDRDHDGLDATREAALGTDDRLSDTDADGLTDAEEQAGGTNPLLADTDGDGFKDGDEVSGGYDPTAPASNES